MEHALLQINKQMYLYIYIYSDTIQVSERNLQIYNADNFSLTK